MRERNFQDATAAVLQSVPRSRRHVGLIRSILQPRPLHLKLGMLCNMLKILGEIIMDERGVRLRSLALMLFCREYDNVRKEKGMDRDFHNSLIGRRSGLYTCGAVAA
jgi:hypothetical protein